MKVAHIVEGVGIGIGSGTCVWLGWRYRKTVATHFKGLFGDEESIGRVAGLLETFFNEAAVLWFVFPLLDAIYEARKGEGIHVVDALKIVAVTWFVALLFFYFAIFFKKLEEDVKKRLAQKGKLKDG